MIAVNHRLIDAFGADELPRDLGICGPAGTGKTFGILAFLHVLMRDNRELQVLACRDRRVNLTESVIKTYERDILPLDGFESMANGPSRATRREYVYPRSKSRFVMMGLDKPGKVFSTDWDMIYVNEAIDIDESAHDTLKTRLRRPGMRREYGYLLMDFNPGHPLHWLKRRADENELVMWNTFHEDNPEMYDGEDWTEGGLTYLAQLDDLPDLYRDRYLKGLWVAGKGAWFASIYNEKRHVNDDMTEYDPKYKVYLSIDPGATTGATFFQLRPSPYGPVVTCFGDYMIEDSTDYDNANELLDLAETLCEGRIDFAIMDPAGKSRTSTGVVTVNEYRRAGLPVTFWKSPPGSVVEGLRLMESLLRPKPTATYSRMLFHSRCKFIRMAMNSYMRAKIGNQWMDYPKDPQHPYEDIMDSLRCGSYAALGGNHVRVKAFAQ